MKKVKKYSNAGLLFRAKEYCWSAMKIKMEKNKHPIEVVMRHWIIFISSGILLLLKFLAIFLDVTESVPNLANIEAGITKPKNKNNSPASLGVRLFVLSPIVAKDANDANALKNVTEITFTWELIDLIVCR